MDFERMLLLGNGPGDLPVNTGACPYVIFNKSGTRLESGVTIRVSNRKVAGLRNRDLPFLVSSEGASDSWCDRFQIQLSLTAKDLERELDSLPSVGLATAHALSCMGVTLQLYRMPLCPSLIRSEHLSEREPLPAAFHNWLGERRLAWQLLLREKERWHWPQLFLACGKSKLEPTNIQEPLTDLWDWFSSHAGLPDTDITELKRLSELPLDVWLNSSNKSALQALERFLFLSRKEPLTPNWWLYRNDLSPLINRLQLRLMQVQQHLYSQPQVN